MTTYQGPETPPHVLVDVRDLRRSHQERAVVDGVAFQVRAGEVFGGLGPDGAGRTTTVERVAGPRVPDGGTVRVAGLGPRAGHPAVSHLPGVQHQESALPAKITVREALVLFASFPPVTSVGHRPTPPPRRAPAPSSTPSRCTTRGTTTA
ncbi:ATP-binding cassette domain-containing protein [Streptomyces sp. SPB074]|uniref:ATP-binding cassette domain-containing protein n=1 Tax=Streptomyces sp. (strain SPB074) TaxID=465543 RepID=UPI00017F1B61|nr:ATP-binding cassette domain-containing protein [Streptomyces sp. SPB074]EFG64619.1 ABC transporter, ATP-binding protein [Streptomyces sp. SPB074]